MTHNETNALAAAVVDLAARFPHNSADIVWHATAQLAAALRLEGETWPRDNENAEWLDVVAEHSANGERWAFCVGMANKTLGPRTLAA